MPNADDTDKKISSLRELETNPDCAAEILIKLMEKGPASLATVLDAHGVELADSGGCYEILHRLSALHFAVAAGLIDWDKNTEMLTANKYGRFFCLKHRQVAGSA